MSIANKLNKLEETKAAIKTAITNKGVEVSDSDTFASYADKINSIPTGGSDLGFEDIGYSYTPTYIEEGLEVGKQIYDTFDSTVSSWSKSISVDLLNKCTFFPKINLPKDSVLATEGKYDIEINSPNLEIFPDVDLGDLKFYKLAVMFRDCYNLKSLHFRGTISSYDSTSSSRNIITGDYNSLKDIVFYNTIDIDGVNMIIFNASCPNLEVFDVHWTGKPIYGYNIFGKYFGAISNDYTVVGRFNINIPVLDTIDTIDTTDIDSFSIGGLRVKVLPKIDISRYISMSYILSSSTILKITELDCRSISTFTSLGSNNTIYALLKNLGTPSALTKINLKGSNILGIETEEVPESAGALQALKDSLITYSFDRATAGYDTCTITLYADTKALLSEDEIAQITAKGFTIA